ncbi:MAG: glycosyltransferase family 39 protein [Acidobacteriota bacterium]|nr:glycosyltransferase family 39 protein [Acidobacteriota bacterium]
MQSVWRALWTSRLVVLFAGIAGVVQIGVPGSAWSNYDQGRLTAPFGYLANAVVAPLARWDSVWYLKIAAHGYAHVRERMAFYPLYPGLMHVLGWATRSDLVAGVLISLAALAVALFLIARLVALDFGEQVATTTVLLIAFCPVAFFLSAVYTESLFLALSVATIYAARRERWLLCGALGFLAALSRNGGVALLLPTAIIYLYGPRQAPLTRWGARPGRGLFARLLPRNRLRLDALALLLIPAGLGAYLAYLQIRYGDGLAPFRVESVWYRHSTLPWSTVWHGARQAWHGLVQLFQGPLPPYRVPAYAQNEIGAALQDVYLFLFLVLGVIALLGVLWRLGAAYGLYALALLVLALADPVSLQPLASLPRYELVIFPLFIWAARLLTRWRLAPYAIPALAVLLGLFTVEFATWRWVA